MANLSHLPGGDHQVAITGGDHQVAIIFGEGEVTTDDLERRFSSQNQTVDFFKGKQKDAGEEHFIPYPDLRFASVKDFVTGLKEKNQNPADLLKEVTVFDKSGEPVGLRAFDNGFEKGLVDLLIKRFPVAYGADTQHLDSKTFPFAKRAQLAALMLHGRAVESPDKDARLLPFVDIDKIGPVVDYQIPRTLRAMNILEYSKNLADRIDNWQEIPKDSHEEIEIRAATARACDTLLKGINKNRKNTGQEGVNMAHLDYFLWVKSRTYKGTRPHLTETDAY